MEFRRVLFRSVRPVAPALHERLHPSDDRRERFGLACATIRRSGLHRLRSDGALAACRQPGTDHAAAQASADGAQADRADRSEEHTSELQSLMRTSYSVLCLKKKKHTINNYH